MPVWVAFVDDDGPLHTPIRWKPPMLRTFKSGSIRIGRDSVGDVLTVMWRGSRSLERVAPRDRASRKWGFRVSEGETLTLTWNVGMNWHETQGLPVSLQFEVEEAIRRWAQ